MHQIIVGVAQKIRTHSDAALAPANSIFLFSSGTPGLDQVGKLPESFAEQAERAWQHIQAILAADMSVDHIIRLTQYLTRREHLTTYREHSRTPPRQRATRLDAALRPETGLA